MWKMLMKNYQFDYDENSISDYLTDLDAYRRRKNDKKRNENI